MICPLRFSIQFADLTDEENRTEQECRKEDCHWWIKFDKGLGMKDNCSIPVIASEIVSNKFKQP